MRNGALMAHETLPTPDPAPPPPVKWAQRPDVVLITIPLRDISEEQLSVSERKLSISVRGGSEQKGFSAELDLFKPVVPSASRHSKSHRELLVLLRKREPGPYWSQLVRGSSNPPFISVDVEKWRDEVDSGDEGGLKGDLLIPSEPISVAMDAQAHVGEECEEPLPPLEVLSSSRAVHEKVVVANGIEEVEDLRGYESDIPVLDEVPTLESILNQDADDTLSVEELGLEDGLVDMELLGSQGAESWKDTITRGDNGLPPYSCVAADSLVSFKTLHKLSRQLKKFAEKKDTFGTPTCIASGGPLVAVGTSKGCIFLFDFDPSVPEKKRGALRSVLGGENVQSDWESHGSATTLSFNCDNTRLLVGHAKGQLVQWDVESAVCLRDVSSAHPRNACILQVKYTDLYNTALFSDISGSIYRLTFKKVYGSRTYESMCIFSGSQGEALVMEPLRLQWDMPDHPVAKHHLVAIGTVDKVIVVSLKPVKAVTGVRLRNPPDSLPLVSWKVCNLRSGDSESYQPILAAARGCIVYFSQVSCTGADGEELKGKIWRHYKKQYYIIALHWLASHFVVAMDTSERMHLIHVPNGQEYQVVDVSGAGTIYSSSAYKALEAGTDAPRAMVAVGKFACQNCVVMRSGAYELFMLGAHSVSAVTLATWKQRIHQILLGDKSLTSLHRVLELAMGYYQGKYCGMIGYRGTENSFKRDVKKAVGQLINEAHRQWMAHSGQQDMDDANWVAQLKSHFTSMIEMCLHFKLHKVLFGTVFDPFQESAVMRKVYFDTLEPFILAGRVPYLTAPLMKMMLAHYQSNGRYFELQSCLVNLDISMLDLNEAVRLCLDHGLCDGLLYVYNRGLQDYVTPLQELLLQLRRRMKEEGELDDYFRTMGYKLLVYISCCLAGRAYPKGEVPRDIVHKVKVDVCQLLFMAENKFDPKDSENYPHMRTLLLFDTREFLNVLTLSFEEPEFDLAVGAGLPSRQEIVQILMRIINQSTSYPGDKGTFTATQIGCLFTFLARQGARHPSSIQVPPNMYNKVLEYLTTPDEEFVTEERQQAFLELLDSGALGEVDSEQLLLMAENAKFYRACERFYEKKRHFVKVLSCYWRDPKRKSQAFFYIHQVMSSDNYSAAEKEEIEKATVENFEGLILTDARATSRLLVTDFPHRLATVLPRLASHKQAQFTFLEGVFESKQLRPETQIPPHVGERYIDLMCQFKPEALDFFLRNSGHYRVEEALTIVGRHGQNRATAYLKERMGDYDGAYDILRKLFRSVCSDFTDRYHNSATSQEAWSLDCEEVVRSFEQVLNLLLRSSRSLPEDRRNGLWYKFLDLMLYQAGHAKRSPNSDLTELFKELLMRLLNAMTMFISLTEILQLILKDEEFSSGHFKDFKQLFLGMFETHNYERVLRVVTSRILHDDVTMAMQNLRMLASKGMTPSSLRCVGCGQGASTQMGGAKNDVVLFHCSHLYHSFCLYPGGGVGPGDPATPSCPKCTKSSEPLTARGQTLRRSHLGAMSFDRQQSVSEGEADLEPWQIANLDRLCSASN